jgi:hypothetical protein
MAREIIALVLLGSLPLVATGTVLWIVFVLRRHHTEKHRLHLSSNHFAGHPEVVVYPAQWKLPAAGIRQLARQRGYAELPQPNPQVMVFRLGADGHGAAVPEPLAPPDKKQHRRQAELVDSLATESHVWVQQGDLGAGIDTINEVARQHGFGIARSYGDRTNPMLLLSRVPVTRVDEVLPRNRRKPLTSVARHWAAAALVFGSFALVGVILGAVRGVALPTAAGAALLTLPILTFVSGAALPFIHMFRSETTRMRLLLHEFDGRNTVRLLPRQYLLDRLIVGDIAAELGYDYVTSAHSWWGTSKWNDSWITYTRNGNYQARER